VRIIPTYSYLLNQEQLLLATEMLEGGNSWEVTLVDWESFFKVMVEREGNPSWRILWELTDLLVGGLNFDVDFM